MWSLFGRSSAETSLESGLNDLSLQLSRLMDDPQGLRHLLSVEIPHLFDVERASLLLTEEHSLVDVNECHTVYHEPDGLNATDRPANSSVILPLHNPAVRHVAATGEAVRVAGRLRKLIQQGQTNLSWTAIWVPLLRGTELYGIWLLGARTKRQAFSAIHLRWLTTFAQQASVNLETSRFTQEKQQVAQEMAVLYENAVSARETERSHLARELHDGVLQDLCAVSRDLKILQSKSGQADTIPQLIQRSTEAVNALRTICHDLRPPFLASNLKLALEALVERVNTYDSPPISIRVESELPTLSEETATAIYRIVQESLNNAIEHAEAAEIAVHVNRYPEQLLVSVVDDGCGLPHGESLSRYVEAGHLGLLGMRERARMIGGTLSFHSAQDYGTAVRFEYPLSL
ncbi:MAG: GAF domain-containing sensor histidine kinase [Chloroflexota bacterium]